MLPLRHHHASWHTIPRRIAFAVILMFFVSLLLCTASVSHPAHAAHLAALQSCTSSSAPGVTMTCTISTAAEIDSITLTGTSGEVYLLRVAVTAGTMHPLVRVNGPGGTLICQTSSPYSLGAEIAGCILTQSGTQTISISDTAATATGSYNLYVQRLSAPANPTPLIIGEVHPATITTGAEATTFTFTGSANDAYLLRMGVTAGTLRPSVRVFGADGTMICSASQPYALGTEITRCLLPQSGTYTVLAADTSVALTGSYNVSIQRLTTPVGATALTMGATATATIQASSEADTYTLTGTANAVFLLRMGVTAGSLRPNVRVFGTDGTAICSANQPYALGTEISRCVLPQSGTFTVMATDTAAVQTGSYNLYVQQLTAPVGATPLAWGEPTSTTLPLPAALDSYTIPAAASDLFLFRVAVTAGTLRPVISVFDPDGVSICTASQPYALGAEIAQCLIPRDGTFLVVVGDTSATQTGSYSLYVQRLTAPVHTRVIGDSETLAGAIRAPAAATAFRWSAGAHDQLRITMAITGGGLRPNVRVFDPAGTQVCAASNPYSTSVDIATCLLPRSGTYTVLVGDASVTGTGTYRVGLSCLSTPCGAAYTAVMGPQGGQVTAGELQMDIPAGAFASQTTIQITPQLVTTVPLAGGQRIVRSFAILAVGAGNAPVTTATLPVTYTLHAGDLDLPAQGITASSVSLAFGNVTGPQWTTVSQSDTGDSLSASSTTIADVALLATTARKVYLPLLRR